MTSNYIQRTMPPAIAGLQPQWRYVRSQQPACSQWRWVRSNDVAILNGDEIRPWVLLAAVCPMPVTLTLLMAVHPLPVICLLCGTSAPSNCGIPSSSAAALSHTSGRPALTVNFCNVQSHYLSLTGIHLVTFRT